MPTFPTKETEVAALAETMVAGYTAHPADFPSIDPLTDLVALQTTLNDYQTAARRQRRFRPLANLGHIL